MLIFADVTTEDSINSNVQYRYVVTGAILTIADRAEFRADGWDLISTNDNKASVCKSSLYDGFGYLHIMKRIVK